jgi:hypothetical protein
MQNKAKEKGMTELSEYYKDMMKRKSSRVKVGMKVKCVYGEYANKIGTCIGLEEKTIRVSMHGLKPLVSDYSCSEEIKLIPTEIVDNGLNWFESK